MAEDGAHTATARKSTGRAGTEFTSPSSQGSLDKGGDGRSHAVSRHFDLGIDPDRLAGVLGRRSKVALNLVARDEIDVCVEAGRVER